MLFYLKPNIAEKLQDFWVAFIWINFLMKQQVFAFKKRIENPPTCSYPLKNHTVISYPRSLHFFLKIRLIFNIVSFGVFVKTSILHITGVHTSKSQRCYVIPSVHYFYEKTKMLADFQICIGVRL